MYVGIPRFNPCLSFTMEIQLQFHMLLCTSVLYYVSYRVSQKKTLYFTAYVFTIEQCTSLLNSVSDSFFPITLFLLKRFFWETL